MIDAKIAKAKTNNSSQILYFIKKFFPYHKITENQINQHILKETHVYLLAFFNNSPIGYIDVSFRQNSAMILGIAVENNFRNNGIGTELLQSAISIIEKKGIKKIYLLVQTVNLDAIQLYLANGFVFKRISKVLVGGKEAYLMERKKSE